MHNTFSRQIKIDLILDNSNEIVNCFNELWSNILIVETDVFYSGSGSEFMYYIIVDNRKQWVFYQGNAKEILLYNSVFIKKYFNIQHDETQCIVKTLLENKLNIIVPTPLASNEWDEIALTVALID